MPAVPGRALLAPVVAALGLLPPAPGPRAAALIGATRAAVVRFERPAAAREAGYAVASVAGPVQHWLNAGYLASGHPVDPHRPAGLVYASSGGGLRLVAALFVLSSPGAADPAIPGAVWHHHRYCGGTGGVAEPPPGGPCPPGTQPETTPDMLHVWLAGTGLPPFATAMDPGIVCRLAGVQRRPGP